MRRATGVRPQRGARERSGERRRSSIAGHQRKVRTMRSTRMLILRPKRRLASRAGPSGRDLVASSWSGGHVRAYAGAGPPGARAHHALRHLAGGHDPSSHEARAVTGGGRASADREPGATPG
jgi:hypothetical protein